MPAFDSAQELAALARLQEELDQLFQLDSRILARVVPSVSGWSAEQHLAHVALANELVVRNLESLASGKGALLVHGAETSPVALEVLTAGVIPRGKAHSPRIVRPPARIERELLGQWLHDARLALAKVDPRALRPGEATIAHQLLGPLDGPLWVRFGVVHTRHHVAIAREVLAASE